jgi:hypothetical protein
MRCTECNSIALRLGTRGRAYCGAHENKAWEQAKEDGAHKSRMADIRSAEERDNFFHERMLRAV